MLLDTFKLQQLILQITYPEALILWDRAGRINTRLQAIWPGTTAADVGPNQQSLNSPSVQIDTSLAKSTLVRNHLTTIDSQTSQQFLNTFQIWRDDLQLGKLNRVSSRALYVRTFPSIAAANAELIAMGLCRMPASKVFDQPIQSENNTVDVAYKFEDASSFAMLRVRTESVKLEFTPPLEFSNVKPFDETRHKLILDFDRGVKGSIEASDFRMDEWLKGFVHVLRRDVEKVLTKV